jgi:DNA invertase Pin-like site-specific DNA recombinase
MARKNKTEAVAYVRTSSATNVGPDKNSEHRQRNAIERFAKHARFTIIETFRDPAVSGADPIETRKGFAALLDRIEGNGIRTVIVEDASRFARDLVTQELGILSLVGRGVRVMTASGDDLTDTQDPFKVAMRQIAGAFAQLEKARLVAKLRHARERKRAEGLRVEGRKPLAETHPEAVTMAKRLRRASPKTGERRSLRRIAAELAAAGFLNAKGKPFSAKSVLAMIEGPVPQASKYGQPNRPAKALGKTVGC